MPINEDDLEWLNNHGWIEYEGRWYDPRSEVAFAYGADPTTLGIEVSSTAFPSLYCMSMQNYVDLDKSVRDSIHVLWLPSCFSGCTRRFYGNNEDVW